MQSQVIDGRAGVQASRIRLLGIHFHTALPQASSSIATDPAWQASCSIIVVTTVIITVIIITNWPVSICPSWCMNPLLTSARHLPLRCTCLLAILREEWYNTWGSGGEAFSGHQMYLLIASKDTFQFQEVLEFNKRNKCVKFSQRRRLFCYSAVFWNPAGWLLVLVKLWLNHYLPNVCFGLYYVLPFMVSLMAQN